MNDAEAESFVRAFEAAWTARDGAAMQALWRPDGLLYTPIVNRPISPHELPRLVALQIRLSPDLRWLLLGWAAAGDVVYVEWKTLQTVHGQSLEWRGMDRFVLDETGLVAEERVFADTAPFRMIGDAAKRDGAIEAARTGVSPDVFIRL